MEASPYFETTPYSIRLKVQSEALLQACSRSQVEQWNMNFGCISKWTQPNGFASKRVATSEGILVWRVLGRSPNNLYIYIFIYVWGPQAFLKHAQPGHRTNRMNQTELREAALAAFISQLKRGGYGIWLWNMALVDYGYGYGSGCGYGSGYGCGYEKVV